MLVVDDPDRWAVPESAEFQQRFQEVSDLLVRDISGTRLVATGASIESPNVVSLLPLTATDVFGNSDDWGILAHTPEARVIQDVGDTVTFGLSYRYHRQRAADFWRATYTAVDAYVSDDPKLARLTTHDLAAKLVVTGATLGLEGRWEALRGEAMIEYYVQSAAFGNAIIAHAALTIPFEY